MPTPTAPDDQRWMPATFRERGVAVPFTSPMLAGARVRLLERRCDIVVPHPGGARGVYILALGSLAEFCAPTMHDVRLAGRLADVLHLTPANIRAAARAVAAEGAAGRAAAAAAIAAEKSDARVHAAYLAMLLNTLSQDSAAEPGQMGGVAVHKLARRTGRTPEAVMADMALLATRLVESGLDIPGPHGPAQTESATPGRGRALLSAVGDLATGIKAWAEKAGEQLASSQVEAAAATIAAAGRLVLEAAQKPLAEPGRLLEGWANAQDAVCARISRLDWLLDGWEHICLLWRVTENGEQRLAAVAEAALLLPPIPVEAESWFATMPALQARMRERHAAGALPRAGGSLPSQVVNLIERNERIRALAA